MWSKKIIFGTDLFGQMYINQPLGPHGSSQRLWFQSRQPHRATLVCWLTSRSDHTGLPSDYGFNHINPQERHCLLANHPLGPHGSPNSVVLGECLLLPVHVDFPLWNLRVFPLWNLRVFPLWNLGCFPLGTSECFLFGTSECFPFGTSECFPFGTSEGFLLGTSVCFPLGTSEFYPFGTSEFFPFRASHYFFMRRIYIKCHVHHQMSSTPSEVIYIIRGNLHHRR